MPLSGFSQTLYDPTTGNLPGDQGWFLYVTSSTSNSSQTYIPNQGVQLVTSSTAQAGYFNRNPLTGALVNPAFPSLNRNNGFALNWDLQINAESHSNNDRAGFSVIFLASDHRGIELGFWDNEIWAQNDSPLFTHGEGVAISTSSPTNYQLTLQGNSYNLFANNSLLLTGPLRDYSAFGPPYSLNDFLFLGDDTTSANADILLGRVTLITAIPEPSTWITLTCLALGICCYFRRQHNFS